MRIAISSKMLCSYDGSCTGVFKTFRCLGGMENRLARIIKPIDGKAVMLAVDHGYFLGPTEKLEDPRKTVEPLVKYCDSLMLTRGIQRSCVDPRHLVPIVLRVSGGSSIIGEDLSHEDIVTSVKEAVRLNASALAMSGSKYEHKSIVNLGKLVNEAEEYGIPVLAVTAVGKEMARDARYLSLACRIAAEQGARIVKTYHCKDFENVVNSCPVPVIIAGGKKIPEKDALTMTYNAIKSGAAGVDMGRNIWQSENPVPMVRAVRAIVHSNYTIEQAYKMYTDLCKNPNRPTDNRNVKKQFKEGNPNRPTDNRNVKKQFKEGNPNRPTDNRNVKKQFKEGNPNRPTDNRNVKKQFKGDNPNKNRHRNRSHSSNKKQNPR